MGTIVSRVTRQLKPLTGATVFSPGFLRGIERGRVQTCQAYSPQTGQPSLSVSSGRDPPPTLHPHTPPQSPANMAARFACALMLALLAAPLAHAGSSSRGLRWGEHLLHETAPAPAPTIIVMPAPAPAPAPTGPIYVPVPVPVPAPFTVPVPVPSV